MNRKNKIGFLTALVIAALCQPVWAAEPDITQKNPNSGYNLDAALRQTPALINPQSPVEKQQETGSPMPNQDSNVKFMVTRIHVEPSEILTPKELESIIAQYEGRQVSMQELNTAVEEINKLYANKKPFIAKAIILPQKIHNGVINIRLIESHVGKYRVEGTKYISDAYLTQRMTLKAGDLVNLERLEQDVIRFNKTNGSQLRVVLTKGDTFGTTDVVLKAAEQSRQQTVLFGDNAGSKSTGEYRLGAVWTLNSLNGGGDRLTLNTTYAQGTTAYGVGYQTMIDKMGTQLGFNYSNNQSDIISGIFQSLQVQGKSTDSSISINYPLNISLNTKQSLYGELHRKTAGTYYSSAKLNDVTVKSAVIGFSALRNARHSMEYHNLSFTTGYAYYGGAFATTRQALGKLNVAYAKRISLQNQCSFLLRVSGQLNAHQKVNLPATEQFTLGGFSTVRGYSEGVLSGDAGYFSSGEFHFPVGKVQGVAFVDHGGTFSYDGEKTPNNRDCYLTSAGVGVIAELAKNTSLQVFLGVPIMDNKYADGAHWHFYLQQLL